MKVINIVVFLGIMLAGAHFYYNYQALNTKIQEQEKRIAKLERDRNQTWALFGIKQLKGPCENLYISVKPK
jgi:hypothetical protein